MIATPDVPIVAATAAASSTTDLEFERLLADLSNAFINVAPDQLKQRMEDAGQRLVEFLGFDRTSFFRFDDDGRVRRFTTWARPGVAPFDIDDTSADLSWYASQIRSANVFFMHHLPEDLPSEAAAERQYVVSVGMKSVLTIPIVVDGAATGAVSFGSFRNHCDLSEALVRRVRLVGEIFGNALARARADERLRQALTEIQELKNRLQEENLFLREEVLQSNGFDDIIGESPAFRDVLAQVGQVCATDATVLITGETGTGKELIARAIHRGSKRIDRPFVAVNCSALPATLIESELFGHEKGAFTGAIARKLGRFEIADGGTIFLDEVGDLALELQPKLLRVLQEGELQRLGSTHSTEIDVRVIAATNRFLPGAVEAGRFREDLFYRLNVFPIRMPPLRDRKEDIPLLAWFLINRKQDQLGKRIDKIPREAMRALTAYTWPGNVRELENVIERAMILSPGPVLQVDVASLAPTARSGTPDGHKLEEMERAHIQRVLRECSWKINGSGNAAERLGLNPSTLRFRMKKLGIERA